MGVCGSKPLGCVGRGCKSKKRNEQTSRKVKKPHSANNRNRVEPSNQSDFSYSNAVFQGKSDSWFEPDAMIESDVEDEFYSVQDDISQPGSLSNVVTPRFANNLVQGIDSHLISDDPQTEVKNPQPEDENVPSCGFISNAILPCIESLDVKKKSPVVGGKKRLGFGPSFKWKEGQEDHPIASKAIVRRPIAGSQITCSPWDKKISESWSHIEPSSFKVRGQNYMRDKKKEFAPNFAAYVPFGVDVFLSPHKIDHIARFVELPAVDLLGEVPPILVVNLQIPLYPATIFQNEYDGTGMSFVFYFKLSENYSEIVPRHFRDNIKKIIANETERIKGFPMDTNVPFQERLKIMGRVANLEDLQLTPTEKKLMQAYNEKPVLSRPQHHFYLEENYFEIDLDLHRFSYIARKGFETFRDRIKHCMLDFGLTIQGNKAEDLPECMLCCLRLKEIDFTNYCQLSI